jgi:trans-aconitate methyltransferase
MTKFQETVEAWQVAARGDPASTMTAIHPTGTDPAAYDASGLAAAEQVVAFAALPPQKFPRIADFGCGDGRVLKHLLGRGYSELAGVDVSLEMLERAAARMELQHAHPETLRFYGSDGLDLSLRDMDGIFSFAVFIHHTYADGVSMLKTLAQAIRIGGRLALQIPLYDVPREPGNWTDVGVWTPDQFAEAIHAAGCTYASLSSVHTNPGAFSYDAIGPVHHMLQVVERVR